jgi:translation initiation factor 2 subunit 3
MKVPKQPVVNIGMVGHVDHGKTTLTEALTGEWTDRHSEEIKRGVSIKLGYADTVVYKCPKCQGSQRYSVSATCPNCGEKTEFVRAISFVDSPGHETLMATMLSGAALMNGALLLIAANEPCPQPQTKEHLMALSIAQIKNIIIVQNKVDLVNENKAKESYKQIQKFIEGTPIEEAPIIPVSAHRDANIDTLLYAIDSIVPTPTYDASKPARMYIARSFDINKPGTRPSDLVGGVLGGSLIQGIFNIDDEVEIRPGRKVTEKGHTKWESIFTKITSLIAGGTNYNTVGPGGLVGIGTLLDASITKSDGLTGSLAGAPGTLPPIWDKLIAETHLLERAVGSEGEVKVGDIKIGEPLMLTVGTATTVGIVTSRHKNQTEMNLKLPVCIESGERFAISRRIGTRWRLIGYGIIKA